MKRVWGTISERGKHQTGKRVKIDLNSSDVALSHLVEKWNEGGAVVNCSANVAAETNTVFFALLIINYPSPCICVYS